MFKNIIKYKNRKMTLEKITTEKVIIEKVKMISKIRKYKFGYRNWTDKIIEKRILYLTYRDIKAVSVIIDNNLLVTPIKFLEYFGNAYHELSYTKKCQFFKNKLSEQINFKLPIDMLRKTDVTIVFREKATMNYWIYVLSKDGVAGTREDAEKFVQVLETLEKKKIKSNINN